MIACPNWFIDIDFLIHMIVFSRRGDATKFYMAFVCYALYSDVVVQLKYKGMNFTQRCELMNYQGLL